MSLKSAWKKSPKLAMKCIAYNTSARLLMAISWIVFSPILILALLFHFLYKLSEFLSDFFTETFLFLGKITGLYYLTRYCRDKRDEHNNTLLEMKNDV